MIGAGLGSGVVSVFVQGYLPIWRENRQRNAHAAYMAMRLAVMLESYSAACLDFIWSNDNAETLPGQEYPNWDVMLLIPQYYT